MPAAELNRIDPAGAGSEAFTETVGVAAAMACQSGALGSIGSTIRPSQRWAARSRASASSSCASPAGIGQHRPQAVAAKAALQPGHELLVPEVGEAAPDHADQLGAAAAQRACDRVAAKADAVGGGAHAPLGGGGYALAAQRVGDARGGQAGDLRQLPQRGPLAFRAVVRHNHMLIVSPRRCEPTSTNTSGRARWWTRCAPAALRRTWRPAATPRCCTWRTSRRLPSTSPGTGWTAGWRRSMRPASSGP